MESNHQRYDTGVIETYTYLVADTIGVRSDLLPMVCVMKVGDLVRVTGRPRDGWVPFLGIIVEVDGHQYKVRPVSHDKWVYALDRRDMEPIDADK